MSGFEEWLNDFCKHTPNASRTSYLGDAYAAGYTAGQYALNSELGIAANEAAKAERRKVAVQDVLDWFGGADCMVGARPHLEDIIAKAQG